MNKVKGHIHGFDNELTLSNQTLSKLSKYCTRADTFKKQFNASLEASRNTAVNRMCKELDLQIMQNKEVKDVMRHMNTVLQKRLQALKQHVKQLAGQMRQYMVLLDYQDAGYTHYRLLTRGDNCEDCTSLHGTVFSISEAESGENLPPFHPNCDCKAEILDVAGNVLCVVGEKEDKTEEKEMKKYDPCDVCAMK